jgi:hypothetical protein
MRRRSTPAPRAVLTIAATALVVISLAVAGCGGSSSGPGAVVQDALGKVAANDLDGLRGLACAGQEDAIRSQLGLGGAVGSDLVPGVDPKTLLDAVKVDVSKVKVGEATVTGETASVPLSGVLGVTIDTEAMRPLLKKVLEQQGMTMTDAQVDTLLKGLAAYGQSVPVDESVRLVRESGAWKICQE